MMKEMKLVDNRRYISLPERANFVKWIQVGDERFYNRNFAYGDEETETWEWTRENGCVKLEEAVV